MQDPVQYVMLATAPEHGIIHLGEIGPETRVFGFFDINMRTFGFYDRSENYVINKVYVPNEQVARLTTIDKVLKIKCIHVKRELFPR